jgi:hypothetical protein
MENRRDDEIESAVFEAIKAANEGDVYPTVADLGAMLSGRGLVASDVAAAADRLYRANRIGVNNGGGVHVRE